MCAEVNHIAVRKHLLRACRAPHQPSSAISQWGCQQSRPAHRLGALHACERRQRGSSSAATSVQAPLGAAPALAAQTEPEPAHPLLLYNTMARQKQRFAPRPDQGSRVSLYCCGVTVYDYSHIGALGRLRLRRWLLHSAFTMGHGIAATRAVWELRDQPLTLSCSRASDFAFQGSRYDLEQILISPVTGTIILLGA